MKGIVPKSWLSHWSGEQHSPDYNCFIGVVSFFSFLECASRGPVSWAFSDGHRGGVSFAWRVSLGQVYRNRNEDFSFFILMVLILSS